MKLSQDIINGLKSTKVIEEREGLYRQKIITHGKKRKVTTERIERNPEKVILCYLGNIEFHCYPFQNQDKIYARIGDNFIALNKYEIKGMIAVYNILKWVTDGGIKKALKNESMSKISKEIKEAYKAGYDKDKAFRDELKKLETKEQKMLDRLKKENLAKMPKCECGVIARGWFGNIDDKPVRVCLNCGRVYDEDSGKFIGFANDLDPDIEKYNKVDEA